MSAILASLAVSIAAMLAFIGLDAHAAYDDDPRTHTLSMYLRRWARESGGNKLSLAFGIHLLGFALAYLFLHLVLQVV